MRKLSIICSIFVVMATGCDPGVVTTMQPVEAFQWCEHGPKVSFGAPPAPWERSKHQSADTGLAFIYADVPPGYITVGEFNNPCSQDARPKLRELYERFEELTPSEFQRVAHAASRFRDTGYSYAADDMIVKVNEALTQAKIAHRRENYAEAQAYVETALDEAEAFEYSLEDLLEHFQFDPEDFDETDRYTLEKPIAGSIDSLPSISISYTMTESRGLHHGRKVYVAWDNHLFLFSYLGPEKYLPTFEAMLATVTFPEDE